MVDFRRPGHIRYVDLWESGYPAMVIIRRLQCVTFRVRYVKFWEHKHPAMATPIMWDSFILASIMKLLPACDVSLYSMGVIPSYMG